MKQYTLEELAEKYEKDGFVVFVYNEASGDYVCGNDELNRELLEWQYIKDNMVTNVEVSGDEVVLSYHEEEEEETEETEEPTTDDIYRANGFASEADFWRWKEGR